MLKISCSLSPWQPLVKLFSQGGRSHTIKIGCQLTGNQSKKLSHAPGFKLICGPGPNVKIFLHRENEHFKIVAFKRSI
jgi:hypothetical protein